MSNSFTHDTFLSPYTWRYGSDAMRQIWSESHKRKLWRQIWVALAEAQEAAGLVKAAQVKDLQEHQNDIDLDRAHEIESQIHHDLMAEIRTYAEQSSVGGGIIHLGATSMDIEDNAEALRLRESMTLIIDYTQKLLMELASLIEREADHVCMAFTHLQPAEPTTVGYRLAGYAQDLLTDYAALQQAMKNIRGKGFKGAVGTAASYNELLAGTGMTPAQMEAHIMNKLDLDAFTIATQTYPRRQDWDVINALAGLAMTIYRMAFDMRVLQSPPFGEWSEPFGASQVGSSAMPFKRNPINAENLDSLARYLAALPRVAWDNAAHNLLERTLDDSGNRRIFLPEAFLTAEELLIRSTKLVAGLRIDAAGIQRNLETYGVFAATERLLMEAARNGGNRQDLHEVIREHSLKAWEAIRKGDANPLVSSLSTDATISRLVAPQRVKELLQAEAHIGDAPVRARQIVSLIKETMMETA
ncbi:MAG: adenylosuccinate lyase [Anaerolineaceae bacterium]|nr:adenylosuccinate lyase [Anaerolineaceae bacterium]